MPSDTVTLMECMPFCDSVGVQANIPVVLCIVTPVGGLVMPYVRLFAGMSVSVAVMFSVSLESSCAVWFGIAANTGGVLTSRTVMVNSWESVAVPSYTVTLM